MDKLVELDNGLTPADRVVLRHLAADMRSRERKQKRPGQARGVRFAEDAIRNDENADESKREDKTTSADSQPAEKDEQSAQIEDIKMLKNEKDPSKPEFEPTVFLSIDQCAASLPASVNTYIVEPYVRVARKVVRHETDVVMLTHLLLYFSTIVPSAVLLFRHFRYAHAILHLVLEVYYVGTYTLMMHQHIHMRGILAKQFALFDCIFPYITDPLMGHTWNTYYYHHVKHHHVEANGPDDLSSTIRYQRDSIWDFAHYVGRFYFLIWFDLPLYFMRKQRYWMGAKAGGSEVLTYVFYYIMATYVDARATLFVYLLPLMLLRMGLMVGNWGQHAFVDPGQPDSDYRSSITVVDVASNRFCFNDGYHTSHHLNPLRHWRDHPISFLEQKHTYANEGALIFHNIDFLMITFRLMMHDYETLAKCLVPIGEQIDLTLEGRVQLLKKLTRKLTDEEIRQSFGALPQR